NNNGSEKVEFGVGDNLFVLSLVIDKDLINLVLPDVRSTCIYYQLKELRYCAQCLIIDEDFIKRSRSTLREERRMDSIIDGVGSLPIILAKTKPERSSSLPFLKTNKSTDSLGSCLSSKTMYDYIPKDSSEPDKEKEREKLKSIDEQVCLGVGSSQIRLSPQYSLYSNTHFIEVKESFTSTEVSKFASTIGKGCEDGKVSDKTSSLYRVSTGSEFSDDSSSGSYNSAIYKPHK
nr:serine/threonine-protein kinase D6PK-like [Tanacetum cinerariifolium]